MGNGPYGHFDIKFGEQGSSNTKGKREGKTAGLDINRNVKNLPLL